MLNQTKVIFAVGALLSILVFNLIKSNQTKTWENEFSNLVQKEMILLIGKLEVNMQVLLGVRSLFNSSVHVDREEFKTFVAPILERNSFIQALEWIPRVPDSLRSEFEEGARKEGYPDFGFQELSKEKVLTRANSRLEYFPVYYLEPLEGNQAALGFDLASNEVRKKSLLESRDSGKAAAGLLKDRRGGEKAFGRQAPTHINVCIERTVGHQSNRAGGTSIGAHCPCTGPKPTPAPPAATPNAIPAPISLEPSLVPPVPSS